MRLFDYALRNARPIRLALDRHAVRARRHACRRQDTQIDIAGLANLHDQTINMRANGDANLAVLRDSSRICGAPAAPTCRPRSKGRLDDPIAAARWRSKAAASVTSRCRTRSKTSTAPSVRLARRHARRADRPSGRRDVQFGGRIDKEGYLPGRLDVTMSGSDMRLRFPEGMRSLVDARSDAAGDDGRRGAVGPGRRQRRVV